MRQVAAAHVDRHGGFVALTRYDDVVAAARAADGYSSRSVSIPASGDRFIPITLDGTEHAVARAVLAPFFSPRQVKARKRQIQSTTDALLDRLASLGEADISVELTRVVPTVTLLQLIGVPAADIDRVAGWTDTLIFDEHATAESGGVAARALQRYLYDLVGARSITAGLTDPTGAAGSSDLIDGLLAHPAGRQAVDIDDAVNMVTTLLFGGLGPTTFLMNGALHRIAADPHLRQRLLVDPDLLTPATEEFLRLVSPVASIGRVVAGADHPLVPNVSPGDQVLLVWAAANRDDDQFDDAESFVADRSPNRHLAFGAGVHRCLGAHLARLQFRIVVGSVLQRLPDYAVSDPGAVGRLTGHMEGIHRLPIRFTPTG